jgi:signal transduction protein with GAF and PtsI domain
MLIVVYAGNVHLQLHNCTGYVVSDELGEVTFVAESPERLSGLVVERGASCSSYAAMNRELISSDFSKLGVEAMLSGVAMSLAEEILSSKKEKE